VPLDGTSQKQLTITLEFDGDVVSKSVGY